MMESFPQRPNEKVHRSLDFLTKFFTQSNKGEENNKLTLSQQRQRVASRQGKKMPNSKTKEYEFSEIRVFEIQYQDGMRVWDPEQMPKTRNSFRR
jgi:hypothetical protein